MITSNPGQFQNPSYHISSEEEEEGKGGREEGRKGGREGGRKGGRERREGGRVWFDANTRSPSLITISS